MNRSSALPAAAIILLAAGCTALTPATAVEADDMPLARMHRMIPDASEVLTWEKIMQKTSDTSECRFSKTQSYEKFVRLAAVKQMIALAKTELKLKYDRQLALRLISLTRYHEELSADLARQLEFYPGADLKLDTTILPTRPPHYDLPQIGQMEQLALRCNSGQKNALTNSEIIGQLRKSHAALICAKEKFSLLCNEPVTPMGKLDRIQAAAELLICEKRLCQLLGLPGIRHTSHRRCANHRQSPEQTFRKGY